MSLVSFEEARPWARSIKNRVVSHQMPPWHIDKTVGITEFENDRSLSDKEIDMLTKVFERVLANLGADDRRRDARSSSA